MEENIEQTQPNKELITFRLRKVHLLLTLPILTFVGGIAIGFLFWGQGYTVSVVNVQDQPVSAGPASQSQVQPAQQPQQEQAQVPQDVTRYEVPIDDDPVLGAQDAPITMIEFSDYECPFCTKFHNEVFGQLIEEYGSQIRFVYRDFPLTSIHPEAFPAAEAANCAGEQGNYWGYHDKLFKGGPEALSADAYIQYAEELSLDMAAFQECLETRRYQDEVQADLDYAVQLGVRSTPTFFINGIGVVGAQPYEVFQQVIENELAGVIP